MATARTGIGLRGPHLARVMAAGPPIPWLEVHAENYMGGGPAVARLERLRRDYPVAVHGVGLSLGTAGGLDRRHLDRLRRLVERLQPCRVSEHLSWSAVGGAYLNHLLPLPYTEEALAAVRANVAQAQEAIGRPLLLENPSHYVRFAHSPIPEPEFLAALARATGCGILCDVNNAHVSGHNLGFSPAAYVDALPAGAVGQIHLAGHSVNEADGRPVLIDDHGSRVADAVWALFARAVRRFGPVPALVEWDTDLPPLETLLDEARRADRVQAAAAEDPGRARAA